MQLDELLRYFQGVKPLSGKDHYTALCPCHNDHEPSLDIKAGNKGVIMACPVCGADGKQVMNALNLSVKELFYEQLNPSTNRQKPKSVDYYYSDSLKKTRFYIWDNKKQDWKKSFCWWHKENNKWIKGLPKDENGRSIAPPLYNQNNLAAAQNGDTIYIVEGEKDVNTLTQKLNLLAICSPHGASTSKDMNRKWSKAYNKLFKGLNVAVIADNDNAGHLLAEYVANELLPYAKTVKVINLCDEWESLKEKGDITDIYENETPAKGKTIAETVAFKLSALTDLTKPYEPSINTAAQQTDPEEPQHKAITAPIWAYESDGQWKINERVYIMEFVKGHGVKCINGQLYSVDGAIPDGKAKQTIIKEILYFVRTNHGDKAEKLLKGIKSYCYTEPPKPSLDKIHFKNGTLSKDKGGLFTVWSDEKEFCINRIDCNYNPFAPTPKLFYKYLSEVYYPDDIKTLQQFCGYCLLPTTVLQKALIIIGDGGEGKSVLGAILNGVIGEKNCYNSSIKDLEGNFGVANVENKLIYIDDDVSEKAITNSGIFKSLVTNKNTIEAKKKFHQSNVIKSYIRFICFGNFGLQALYDTSDGFYRRLLALRVKPKDENRMDNPFIDRQIIDNEAEGVINWLVQGLNEIIKRNFDIYTSERTQAESECINHENDSVLAFLQSDHIAIDENLKIHTTTLYNLYSKFCEENALNKLTTASSFSRAINNRGRKFGIVKNNQVVIKGKRARGFYGIGITVNIAN